MRAFLINGWPVIDQFPQLTGRLNIASEKDEATGLKAAKGGSRFGIEFRSGHAGEEELAERRAFHIAPPW